MEAFLFQKSDEIPTLSFSYQSNLGLHVDSQTEETGEEEGRGSRGNKCKGVKKDEGASK